MKSLLVGMLVKTMYNRPKIVFALMHTPLICLDQDRSDVNNSPKYLNVGTVSNTLMLPLMVVVGGLINPVLYCIGI